MRFFFVSALFAASAFAQEAAKLTDEPTFREIFHQSVADASQLTTTRRRDTLTLELSGAFRSPETLTLTNSSFEVKHGGSLRRILGAGLGIYAGLLSSERAQLGVSFGTGFSYIEYVGSARSVKTGLVALDSFNIQHIPLTTGLRGSYALGPVAFFVEPQIGLQWIVQSGTLDGISKNFRIPIWGLAGGILLFDRISSSTGTWFGGLRLAAGMERGLSSSQQPLAMNNFELGVRMRL